MIAKALNVPMGSFFDSGNQEADAGRTAKIERMVRELDEDYIPDYFEIFRDTEGIQRKMTPRFTGRLLFISMHHRSYEL
jgi:hypothetical protein